MWYQDTINLFDCRLVGPFDFVNGYHVPPSVWKTLQQKAEGSRVYVGALNRIVPLDKPDPMDAVVRGRPASYLSFRWNIFTGTE